MKSFFKPTALGCLVCCLSVSIVQANFDDDSVDVPGWSAGEIRKTGPETNTTYLGDYKSWSLWSVKNTARPNKAISETICYGYKAGLGSGVISENIESLPRSSTGPGVRLQSRIENGKMPVTLMTFYGKFDRSPKVKLREVGGADSFDYYGIMYLERYNQNYEFEITTCNELVPTKRCELEKSKIDLTHSAAIRVLLEDCAFDGIFNK